MLRLTFLSALTALSACCLVGEAVAQTVVNVDVGTGAAPYLGLGLAEDAPGHTFWNGISSGGSSLLASDGVTPTTVSVQLTSAGGFDWNNANGVLADYQFVSVFQATVVGDLTISGLAPNADYTIYVYGTGNAIDQGGAYTLNGVTEFTGGSVAAEFLGGPNTAVIEVESDAAGVIAGTWQPLNAAAALCGLQIVEGGLPSRVRAIRGAESPTVHSPGDPIRVTVEFSENVTLSQAGDARLLLDYGGLPVTALHTGAASGTELIFEAAAPAVTTGGGFVEADGLELLAGATLVDDDFFGVELEHPETPLDFDRVSIERLAVYPPVPGLAESAHYRFRVRDLDGGPWLSPFAFSTQCRLDEDGVPYGYYEDQIGGWSHTYCNFETANNVPLEIEITRLGPDGATPIEIRTATPHPRRRVRSWRVEDGKAYVTIDRPTLFAVDIDEQLDGGPTPFGAFVNDDALHGVSVFANPFLLDKPDLNDPDVLAVAPGTIPPDDDPRSTLYFLPGVHQIFAGGWDPEDAFRLRSDRTYYIPGDALVHGNFNNRDTNDDARGIRIYGHGTLSGERIPHPIAYGLTEKDDFRQASPVRIANKARGCSVEGVTFTDPAFHTCGLIGDFNLDPADHNNVRWAKAVSWRANGDGITPNGSAVLEDCFLRLQDDGSYIRGTAIRRVVYWTDVNGMPLRCSQLTSQSPGRYLKNDLEVEDIDVIYARGGFVAGPGNSVIGFPDPNPSYPGNDGSHAVFRDVQVEDPFATRRLFGWDLATGDGATAGVSGVRFENVRAVAPTVADDPNTFLGVAPGPIDGLVFVDVTQAGRHFAAQVDFETNALVGPFLFAGTAPELRRFLDVSGSGKWHVNDDWEAGLEPADNDLVEHVTVGSTLTVEAPAWAGTLTVGHPDTAAVALGRGGDLTVTDAVSIGAAAPGELRLLRGVLRLESDSAAALAVGAGQLHFERGELRWAGDHVQDIAALQAAGKLSFTNGRRAQGLAVSATIAGGKDLSTLIGRSGSTQLYARYDAGADVTTVWASEVQGLRQRP